MNQTNKKLALVLPGGGTRGVIQNVLLSAIDEKLSSLIENYKGIGCYVDYIAGTSIGSINAINCIVRNEDGDLRFTPEDNIKLFLDKAGSILVKESSFGGITTPSCSNTAIKAILVDRCGEITFDDEKLKAKILITSFCLNESEPTIWTNIGSEEDRRKTPYHVWDIENIKLKDAVLASSAVPSLLQSHQIQYQRVDSCEMPTFNEIDGAFNCNSPILDLVSDICFLDKVPLSDLFVLSVNTGAFLHDCSDLSNAGTYKYARNIGNLLRVHAQSLQESHENTAKKIVECVGGKLRTIDVPISIDEHRCSLKDSYENINNYKNIAEDFIRQNDEYIKEIAVEVADWINNS